MIKKIFIALCGLAILTSTTLAIIELKETILERTSDSWGETKRIGVNEYVVYRFQGNSTNIINVVIEVVSGDSMDTFLMSSEDFANYQSMMKKGSPGQFNSYPAGKGMNLKYQSYSFELPETGVYYIAVDNTYRPNNGGQPGGGVDVKISFTKSRCIKCEEEALALQKRNEELDRQSEELQRKLEAEANQSKEPEKSTPGFTAIYMAAALFYFVEKRKNM